jgi:hypothetical protein
MMMTWIINDYSVALTGRNSAVGVATRYGLDGPGSFPVEVRFSALVQTGPGAYPASYTVGTGFPSQG